MMFARIAMALALLLASDAHAKTLHPDTRFFRGHIGEYGEWLVGCDNRANCTMVGIPPAVREGDANLAGVDNMIMRIHLAADNEGTPQVELIPAADAASGAVERGQFYLVAWGSLGRVSPYHDYARIILDQGEADMLIGQLRSDGAIYGYAAEDGAVRVRLPGPGFSRAYRVTTKHLADLRKELKTVRPVQTIPGEELMLPSVTSLYGIREGCHFPGEGVTLRRYRLNGEGELWRLQCWAAREAPSFWYRSDHNGVVTSLTLPDPRDGPVAAGGKGLINAEYDFDLGVLRSHSLLDGRPDCGTLRAWGYTASGWQLLERREMPSCSGLLPPDWIRTYDAGATIWRANDE